MDRLLHLHRHLHHRPAPPLSPSPTAAAALRVGLIGNTGGGEYGHGLEKMFIDRTDGVVVAIADADAAKRCVFLI